MFLVKSLIRNKLRRKFPQWSLLAGHCFGTCLKMPFGSLYFQGFQTAGLGNSATLDSGLRQKAKGRLLFTSHTRKQCHVRQWIKTRPLDRPVGIREPARKQCHVRQWIKTKEVGATLDRIETRKQCHVRQWIKTLLLPVPPKPGFRPSETVPR